MKIVLLANWGLGLEILKVLHELPNIEIHLVVTRYSEKSEDIWENAVYEFSSTAGYRTVDQDSISVHELKHEILKAKADLLIIHAVMRILPKEIFSAPRLGSINIHPSLLPAYRGPSPNQWVIRNGDEVTGLTSHFIDEGLDTGDIICQISIPVKPDDTVGSIIERQKTIVGDLIIESLARIEDTDFQPVPQTAELATYAPRIESMRR